MRRYEKFNGIPVLGLGWLFILHAFFCVNIIRRHEFLSTKDTDVAIWAQYIWYFTTFLMISSIQINIIKIHIKNHSKAQNYSQKIMFLTSQNYFFFFFVLQQITTNFSFCFINLDSLSVPCTQSLHCVDDDKLI